MVNGIRWREHTPYAIRVLQTGQRADLCLKRDARIAEAVKAVLALIQLFLRRTAEQGQQFWEYAGKMKVPYIMYISRLVLCYRSYTYEVLANDS